MQPVSLVIPGVDLPETIFAKDQPEYMPLPSIVTEDKQVVSRWKLTDEEKAIVASTGDIYVRVLTFGYKLQPMALSVECPLEIKE